MEQFETTPKKWGNSLGITIPSNVIKHGHLNQKNKITVLILSNENKKIKEGFGKLKRKKSTQKLMREIDEGYD